MLKKSIIFKMIIATEQPRHPFQRSAGGSKPNAKVEVISRPCR